MDVMLCYAMLLCGRADPRACYSRKEGRREGKGGRGIRAEGNEVREVVVVEEEEEDHTSAGCRSM